MNAAFHNVKWEDEMEMEKTQREDKKKLLKRITDKPKRFYSYVRSKQKVKPVIPHLRKENNETTNDQETADVLGKFFESVITTEDDGDSILPEFENSSRKQGFRRDHIY